MKETKNSNIYNKLNSISNYIPGFRSNVKWKKIISVIGYIFMFLLILLILISSGDSLSILLSAYFLFIIIPFIILTDLFNISKKISFFQNKPILFRIIFLPIVFFISFIILALTVDTSSTQPSTTSTNSETESIQVADTTIQSDNTEKNPSEEPEIEEYKYSGEELDEFITDYIKKPKDKYKNKIKQGSPDEVYNLILNRLKNYTDKNSNSYISAHTERLNAYKTLCNLYKDCFPDNQHNSQLDNILELENTLSDLNNQLKDYSDIKSKYEELNTLITQDFYILKVLDTHYDDNLKGTIQKNIDSLTKDNEKVRYLASDIDTTNMFGPTPGPNYFVIEPINDFSSDGIYSLTVIQIGTEQLVDNNGFKSDVPVFKEVSKNYSDDLYNEYNNLTSLNNDMVSKENELDSLLSSELSK